MTFKAAIRAGALKSIGTGRGGIASAESHAKRLDPVAQKRVVRSADPLAWSKAETGPLDYVEAFKAHKRQTGAGERKGATLAIEFKAVVSPEWLAETGNPHDADDPRVRQLVDEARNWAESWGGEGSVWAVRYDTDEKGAGVVDLFMSPVRQQKHKNGKSKPVISCRKAKEELLAAERAHDPGLKTSGAAMQSSWARWCQERLDPRIERGQSKEQTRRDHIHADLYAKAAEEAHRAARAEADRIVTEARKEATRLVTEAQERIALERELLNAEADARETEDWKRMERHLDAHIDRRADQRLAEAERRATRAEKQATEARREAREAQTALRQLQTLWNTLWGRLRTLLGHERAEGLEREVQDDIQRPSRSGLSR